MAEPSINPETGLGIAKAMTGGGASGAVIFGINAQVIGVVAGIAIGVCGLIIQWHFGRKRLQLERERWLG